MLHPRQIRLARVWFARHGPTSLLWRRRVAIIGGAVLVGLAAIAFAHIADHSSKAFDAAVAWRWWLPLILTPAGYGLIAWLTARLAPNAGGSGIPQIIAARETPELAARGLASTRTAVVKVVLTALGLGCGASIGREGPTVQIGASIMAQIHTRLGVRLDGSVLVAGAAAGVAAAFNTPLAGVAFAIEELAVAYEQRMTLLVMTAVLIAGMISLGIDGDYLYFGLVGQTLPLSAVLWLAPVAGVGGGACGAMFSRGMLWLGRGGSRRLSRGHPVLFAVACGLVVAMIGVATGLTWGTGYAPARAMIEGVDAPVWYGPAKFAATLATAAAGLPGGIFAPSLSIGAGLGNLLHLLAPDQATGAVVLLGMAGYFVGVVRAPLTAVIIITETTGSRGLLLPLLFTALVAEVCAARLCPERLYHGLSRNYRRGKSVPETEKIIAPNLS